MTKTTHRFGKRGSGRRTSWFPCGPQEAYCSAAFSFSGGLSSCRSLEHTQKPRRKPSDGDQRPVFFCFFFKALWGPPMPGPWTLRKRERERERHCTVRTKRARCREGNKTENGGGGGGGRGGGWFGSCKSATFSLSLFLDALIIFLRTGRHVPPRHTQAMINAAGLSWTTPPQKFQKTATATNAGYESQASEIWSTESANLTFGRETWRGHWRNECMSDRNMRFWFDEDTLWGRFFFFFFFQSAGLLASVTLMPSAAHALAYMIPPTH